LMSYGSSLPDALRQLGLYTGQVLEGTRPADLPFQRASRIELIINLKTAKTLGITFLITLLGRADEARAILSLSDWSGHRADFIRKRPSLTSF